MYSLKNLIDDILRSFCFATFFVVEQALSITATVNRRREILEGIFFKLLFYCKSIEIDEINKPFQNDETA